MKKLAVLLLLIILPLNSAVAAQKKQEFCANDELNISPNHTDKPLYAHAKSIIKKIDSNYILSLYLYWDDGHSYVSIEKTPLQKSKEKYIFNFEDGWNNNVSGYLTIKNKRLTIKFTNVTQEYTNDASRMYGEYTLKQDDCQNTTSRF